jgi:hypothetical protein
MSEPDILRQLVSLLDGPDVYCYLSQAKQKNYEQLVNILGDELCDRELELP